MPCSKPSVDGDFRPGVHDPTTSSDLRPVSARNSNLFSRPMSVLVTH